MSRTAPVPPPSDYRTAAAAGIASPRLQKSLQGIQNRFGKGAMEFWAKADDQELRHRVKESRMNTLAHLDIVLAELAQNVRARGGQVYFAATAQDAIDYTLAVAKKNNVKRVVKGKSMTSAEIAITHGLELTTGQVWLISGSSSTPARGADIKSSSRNLFKLTMPASSVTTVVLTR